MYRATDTNLKRQVAIKAMPASVAGDALRLGRFQREAEVLAQLNNPHIAAIYGLEKAPDVTALVMELVEGEDLSQRSARGAIAIEEALFIAKQIAEALDEFHHQGEGAGRFLKAVDGGDVRVIERCERLRFALEPCHPVGIGRKGVRKDLDRNLAAERRIGRPPDLAHAAFADATGDFVDAEAAARLERHAPAIIPADGG